jgi:hypothetical protein
LVSTTTAKLRSGIIWKPQFCPTVLPPCSTTLTPSTSRSIQLIPMWSALSPMRDVGSFMRSSDSFESSGEPSPRWNFAHLMRSTMLDDIPPAGFPPRGSPQGRATFIVPSSSLVCPTTNLRVAMSLRKKNDLSMPRGSRMSSLIASSYVLPVTFSMMRPATDREALL